MPFVRNRHLILMVSAIALLGLGLAACSDDDGGVDSSATTTTAVESGSGEEDAEVNNISIDMKDHAFVVTGELKAGTATVALKNSGTEMHMAAFALLEQGKTLADVQAALQAEDDTAFEGVFAAAEVGSPGTILSPGQSQEITTDLLGAGTYALICYIPTAGEQAMVPHFAKGMVGTFEVAAGDVEATAARADAEYTVDDGRTDGPKTLKAGENVLRMTSSGKGPHEFFVMRKREAGATYDDVDTFFTDLFEGETPPPKGYADTAPAIIVASSFDVESATSITLTADLEPGDYLIGCALEPDEEGGEGKAHTGEILDVTVT